MESVLVTGALMAKVVGPSVPATAVIKLQSVLVTGALVARAVGPSAPTTTVVRVSSGGSSPVWISLAAVLIALFAAFVGYVTYRSQVDPEVIVFAELDEDRSGIVNLVIQNIGNAPALDVTFESSAPVPEHAFGNDAATAPDAKQMDSGPLITGVPFLQPSGRRVITWGQYGGLRKALGTGTVWVTAKYRGHHLGFPWSIRRQTKCPLEVVSFEGTDISDRNYVRRIAEAVEKLGESKG